MWTCTFAFLVALGCISAPTNASRHQLPQKHLSQANSKVPIKFRVSDQSFDISNFSWETCSSSSNATIHLNTLVIGQSNAFTIPGDVLATANAVVNAQIAAPLKLQIKAWKKVFIWIELPCEIGQYDLCNIPDACALLPQNGTCPSWMKQNNLPCDCPIPSNTYALTNTEVTVPPITIEIPPFIDDGSYKIEISLFDQNNSQLGCLRIFAKVEAHGKAKS